MRRRETIQLGLVTASLGVLSASGAIAVYGTGILDDDEGDDPMQTPDSSTPSSSSGTEVTGVDFRVTEKSCEDDSSPGEGSIREVKQGSDDGTVSISGVVSAADMCKSARVVNAVYDSGRDALRLTVETFDESDGACAMCVTDISFEATVHVKGELPSTATLSVPDA